MQRKWAVAGWVTFAAVAVAAGIGAVALASGGSLAGPEQPMSDEDVLASLEEAGEDASEDGPSPSPSDSPTATPSSSATSTAEDGGRVLGGPGGTFLAVCEGDLVRIEWWTPAQGWNAANVDQGPAASLEIEFEGADDEVEYTVACVGGVPETGSDDDGDDG